MTVRDAPGALDPDAGAPGPSPTGDPAPRAPVTREGLHGLLARLDIPRDYAAVLGVWRRPDGTLEVHLGPSTFWRTVQRAGLAVTSTEEPERLFPHRHAFTVEGIEWFTFSSEPVLRPGVLTPGYALRLT